MALSSRRRADPDRILCAQLSGAALRLATAGVPVEEAVDELRELANGRGDLLAQEAGLMTGSASVRPVTGGYVAAIKLLILAGADEAKLAHWVEIGWQRVSAPRLSI